MGIPSAVYYSELINRLYKTPVDAGKDFEEQSSAAIKSTNEDQREELLAMFRNKE